MMNKYNAQNWACVILLLALSSCGHSVLMNNLAGKYYCDHCFGLREIVLNIDSTFKYRLEVESRILRCQGKWHIENGCIVLNSELRRGISRVLECREASDSIRITVKESQYKYPFVGGIYFNDDESHGSNLPDSGCIVIPMRNITAKSITIMDLRERYKYVVKDTMANCFDIIVTPNDPGYMYFVNEILHVEDGSRIICQSEIFVKDKSAP